MSEQEAVAYIEEWDVTEAAKVLKWYEEDELLRPCDCDTIVAIETENLQAENAKLRNLVTGLHWCNDKPWNDGACDECPMHGKGLNRCTQVMRELGIEV